MNKIYFDNLCIEITRKCNMNCDHCLRGNSENIDIDNAYIYELLKQTAFIGSIYFCGGEPTLNVDAIETTLTFCKYFKIPVLSFGIKTNGKYISNDFVECCIKWHKYCKKFCGEITGNLSISEDNFHEKINIQNKNKIKDLPFFHENKIDYKKDKMLVDLGKAKLLTNYFKKAPLYSSFNIIKYNNNFYTNKMYTMLTAKGNIVLTCDVEYNDADKNYLCSYYNILDTFENISMSSNKNFS